MAKLEQQLIGKIANLGNALLLNAPYKPAGDQPGAIAQLTEAILNEETYQTLLGVTGSGKTFTMASVIANVQSLRW